MLNRSDLKIISQIAVPPPLPDPPLTTPNDHFPPAALRQTSHVSHLLDRFGFSSHNSMSATL